MTPNEKKAAEKQIGRIKTELALAEAKADYWNAKVNEWEEDLDAAKIAAGYHPHGG